MPYAAVIMFMLYATQSIIQLLNLLFSHTADGLYITAKRLS